MDINTYKEVYGDFFDNIKYDEDKDIYYGVLKKAYKYRIKPTKEQMEEIYKTAGCQRKSYNLHLEQYLQTYTLKNTCKAYKEEYLYLKEVDSLAVTEGYRNLKKAITNHEKNPKHFRKPTYKKRKYNVSYTTYNQGSKRIGVINNKTYIKLPKIGDIEMIYHRKLPVDSSEIKGMTITVNASGESYVSLNFTEYIELEVLTLPNLSRTNSVGLDLGISHYLTLVSGVESHQEINQKYYEQQLEKLDRLDKALAHKLEQSKKTGKSKHQSKNYQKIRRKRAKLLQRISNKRNDYLHKLSRSIVDKYDYIFVEDLGVQGMIEQGCNTLNMRIYDASWSKFLYYLTYKSKESYKILHKISRYYPSTQICSHCDKQTGPSGKDNLGVREWKCSSCNRVNNRDINASINIRNQGLIDLGLS